MSNTATLDALGMIDRRLGSLGEQLARVLEKAIAEGVLAPGTRLPAEAIARHYEVSVIPVREAMRSLEANGWVLIRPNRGAFVRQVDDSDLEETLEALCIVDAELAALAVTRRSDEDIEELERLVSVGDSAIAALDMATFSIVNDLFHHQIALAARNRRLIAVRDLLGKHLRYYMALIPFDRAAASAEEHAALVQAVVARDQDRARAIAAEHSKRTRMHVLDDRSAGDPG